jgi:succinate dehydrogenase / fumarate reductase iron-sulfur subunit
MREREMRLTLRIWRQKNARARGKLVSYRMEDISPDMSFLEMLDVLNEQLTEQGEEPVAFDHDCREGICGMCGLVINGIAHGQHKHRTTTCQLHMRNFRDGETITIEPWRAKGFPIIKDLIVDRSGFDRIIQNGGFITAPTGTAPDAHVTLVPKEAADLAMDAAACIGCGACVAACPNASAMLFASAKISHLGLLPQGRPEHPKRVLNMVQTMDDNDFGGCTNIGECARACPKEIHLDTIARMNRDLIKAIAIEGSSSTNT